ncbi:MAG: cell division protein FtsQ/DivIB [Bacteroidales bacterium]
MIRKFFRIILLSILPVYLLAMFFIFADKVEEEVCKDVQIAIKDSIDTPYLKVKDIENILRRNHFKAIGKPMKEIDTYEIGRSIEENPIIRAACCYKTPDGTLRIDIYQRNPIMRVLGLTGNYYIDEEGFLIPASLSFTAHVPFASGYISKELAKDELHRFALFLQKDKFWNAQIQQIYVRADGEVELTPRVGSHTILLGNLQNFEKKLDNLMTFYDKGLNKKGWNVYKAINLKYENQVIGIK